MHRTHAAWLDRSPGTVPQLIPPFTALLAANQDNSHEYVRSTDTVISCTQTRVVAAGNACGTAVACKVRSGTGPLHKPCQATGWHQRQPAPTCVLRAACGQTYAAAASGVQPAQNLQTHNCSKDCCWHVPVSPAADSTPACQATACGTHISSVYKPRAMARSN